MRLVPPHGEGAKVDPDGLRLERVPAEEQPSINTAKRDPLAEGRDRSGRVRTREAAAAMAKLPRRRDVLPESIATHPDFESHYRQRLDWRGKRRGELTAVGRGQLSHGVGARLDLASWMFAGASFAAEQGAKTGDVRLLTVAATLAAQADRLDWSAYHLSVREGALRPEASGLPLGFEWTADDENGGKK